jgi:hypothetical protein
LEGVIEFSRNSPAFQNDKPGKQTALVFINISFKQALNADLKIGGEIVARSWLA